MALIGLVDPTHDERKADAPGRLPRWIPKDELLATFETANPKYAPYTYEVVHAALEQWQERDYISTTMLVGGCSRSKVLERKEDFILDLDGLWPAFRGTQVHRTLEFSNRPNSLAEARFWTTVGIPGGRKVEVSCSPDLVTQHPAAVVDYKAPVDDRSIPTYGYPWANQVQQLQLNRYIVNHAERWQLAEGDEMPWDPRTLRFERLYIVYLGTRGPKVIECQKSIEVPKVGGEGTKNIKVADVWADELVTDLMVPRLAAMVDALDHYPNWPDTLTDAPGFEGRPGWACPGRPWCKLPDCLAKRYPDGLVWDSPK